MSRLFFLNPAARSGPEPSGLFTADDYSYAEEFFTRTSRPATPLHRLPGLASAAGTADLLIKDESHRFGLSAFKILGADLAVTRLLGEGRLTLGSIVACATAGNHGRAVAHAARRHGLHAVVYVPAGTVAHRIAAIRGEGADVVVFDGHYDDAVREVARQAAAKGWQIVSDTGWPGYDEIPRWIMLGYTRMFDEARAAWPRTPDAMIVQAGVGGLACAAASWLAHHFGARRPMLVIAEPVGAPCLLASARAGRPTALEGPLETFMAGLRCAEVSSTAWPTIAAVADAFVAVSDDSARETMALLENPRDGDAKVLAGPSGACGVAAFRAVLTDPALTPVREYLRLGPNASVLTVVTEGP